MFSRRGFLGTAALVSAGAVSGRVQAAAIPEAPTMDKATMQSPLHPTSGPDYRPVVTLNGWSLPWRMNGDWKEFHLVAEPVVREFAAGHEGKPVGLQRPGAGPDDRGGGGRQGPHLRHQQAARAHDGALARHDRAERHGRRWRPQSAAHPSPARPSSTNSNSGRAGTFMYHPHADEMVQMAMGMMGMFIVHPRDPTFRSRRPRLRVHDEQLPHRARHAICRRSTR